MGGWRHRMGILWAGLWLLALVPWAAPAAAASTITVTTTNDGAGTCTGSAPNITCTTLRGAIAAAASGDTIVFAPGVSGVITLTQGELAISKNLTINGPGANLVAVSGNDASRVFNVGPYSVTIKGLTIGDGGGVSEGAGIYVQSGASFTLQDARVLSNTAAAPSGAARGGGLYFGGGTLTITNVTFAGNAASFDCATPLPPIPPSFSSQGGGLYIAWGIASLTSVEMRGNRSGGNCFPQQEQRQGGGLYVAGGNVSLTGAALSGNDAIEGGGAVCARG